MRRRSKFKSENAEDLEYIELKNKLKAINLIKGEEPKEGLFYKSVRVFVDYLIKAYKSQTYTSLFNRMFSEIDRIYPSFFEPLKEAIDSADLKVTYRTYLGYMMSSSFIAGFLGAVMFLIYSFVLNLNIAWTITGLFLIPSASAIVLFTTFYIYPFNAKRMRKQSIEANLPFAINHMAAIAQSGVPLERAFEMLVEIGDYGGVTDEAERIVRRIKLFGDDAIEAIDYVALRTPSEAFKELLYGINAIVQSGGNLREYLREMAHLALFNYRLSRRKYLDTLSTYADIYTAILIAAPLFLVAILAVINIIPDSTIMGLTVNDFMSVGVYGIIPGTNLLFILVLTLTQPKV